MRRLNSLVTIAFLLLLLVPAVERAADSDKPKESSAEERAKVDAMAKDALQELFTKSKDAKGLYDKASGYAAFSNLKFALGLTGGGGQGVAVSKASGKRTYMKMGTAGIGFGIGGQKSQLVFLFENDKAFNSFVDKGWQAGTQAQASAGKSAADAAMSFRDGVALFQMTEKGLMASADVSGTKYWKDDDLNK